MTKEYTYDSFGNATSGGDGSFSNEVQFTGAIADGGGVYYMNARYYNSNTGRFLTQDTYKGNAYEPWTQHLYTYCGNNPVNYIDPTGHIVQTEADYGNGNSNESVVPEPAVDWQQSIDNCVENLGIVSAALFGPLGFFMKRDDSAVKNVVKKYVTHSNENVKAQETGNWNMVIAASASGNGDEITTLYRAMSNAEYESLMKNKQFIEYNKAMDSKWFATSIEDAEKWGKLFYQNNEYRITAVGVPTKELQNLYFVSKLDNIGPAYCAERSLLNKIIRFFMKVK